MEGVMRVCKRCGAQNFDIKQNCDKCGYPLVEKGSVSTMQKQMNGSGTACEDGAE